MYVYIKYNYRYNVYIIVIIEYIIPRSTIRIKRMKIVYFRNRIEGKANVRSDGMWAEIDDSWPYDACYVYVASFE